MKVLNGSQIQLLIDRFNLSVNVEEGEVVARRKEGKLLEALTVAKMVGLKVVPSNWYERNNEVRGL